MVEDYFVGPKGHDGNGAHRNTAEATPRLGSLHVMLPLVGSEGSGDQCV